MMSEDRGGSRCAAAGCGLSLSGMWFVHAVLRPFDVDGRHFNGMGASALLWHLLWHVTQPFPEQPSRARLVLFALVNDLLAV